VIGRDGGGGGDAAADPGTLELIRDALRGLRYGQVVVTVHDGVVAQVERTEKLRPQRR
jgi:hypothetical protein